MWVYQAVVRNGMDVAPQRRSPRRGVQLTEHVDHSESTLQCADFVNYELSLFSAASNVRSIPSLVDGLKPSQRKVLFTAFEKGLSRELKVRFLALHGQPAGACRAAPPGHGALVALLSVLNVACMHGLPAPGPCVHGSC